MKKNTLKYSFSIAILIFPIITFAAFTGIKGFLTEIRVLIKDIVPIIFGLALVYFFWGTGQFILHAADAKTRDEGKKKMIWGVIALFVMFSIYGILNWIGVTVGITPGGGDIQNLNPFDTTTTANG